MHANMLSDKYCAQAGAVVAEATGLNFPRERWSDLKRGLAAAAEEFGFDDVPACVEWLLSAPLTTDQKQILASHLTVGETYFFRDKNLFATLATHILPELIRTGRCREKRLRIWSAGCCTGEEAYSLAILLHQVLPDLADWNVTILATDINARFLKKATAGAYSPWSFRDTPPDFRELYFTQSGDSTYTVAPHIKKMVTFAQANLVEDTPASGPGSIAPMDLIVCRNVLMYLTPAKTRTVISNLYRSLNDGGVLAVSPSEASHDLFPQFSTCNYSGVILFRKEHQIDQLLRVPAGAQVPVFNPEPADVPMTPRIAAQHTEIAPEPSGSFAMARVLANEGKLAGALAKCNQCIAADPLDPEAHYLRAVILLECEDYAGARRSLQTALYLDPRFVLAHFTLGNLANEQGEIGAADKHFANALDLLKNLQPPELLPASDGLTAGRLAEIITSFPHSAHPQ